MKLCQENLKLLTDQDWGLLHFAECESTMDCVEDLADDLSVSRPGLIVCDNQTKGRGRLGSEWEDSNDALYMTAAFVVEPPQLEVSGFSLVVGCAAHSVLKELGYNAKLKWPNDILTPKGKKLGGILVELNSFKGKLVLSCGIGVNTKVAPANLPEASSLLSVGLDVSRDRLALQISAQLWENWRKFQQYGFSAFHGLWMENAYKLGSWMAIDIGDKVEEGSFMGVSEKGLLKIEQAGRVLEVISGHVLEIRDR